MNLDLNFDLLIRQSNPLNSFSICYSITAIIA